MEEYMQKLEAGFGPTPARGYPHRGRVKVFVEGLLLFPGHRMLHHQLHLLREMLVRPRHGQSG